MIMEEKINIAELLKDCPNGMELDCTIWDNVVFDHVDMTSDYPICIEKMGETREYLTENGCFNFDLGAKCVIFPKGKTTWEGFQRPFEDGDVITCTNSVCSFVSIFKEMNTDTTFWRYVSLTLDNEQQFQVKRNWADFRNPRFATEEEKQKLFDAIKNNGYKWNAETKTLEELNIPKFKIGDKIKHRLTGEICIVLFVISNGDGGGVYDVAITNEIGKSIDVKEQDQYELVPNKFDISTLKAFDSTVLVRDYDNQIWIPTFWGKLLEEDSNCRYLTANGCYKYCIPYDGNQHLLGTTDDCNEFYKTWE